MSDEKTTRPVKVNNPQGLHARPADGIVRIASRYVCKVIIEKDGEQVDAKSILSLLTLAASQGTELILSAQGVDANAAVQALGQYFDRGFAEETQQGEPRQSPTDSSTPAE